MTMKGTNSITFLSHNDFISAENYEACTAIVPAFQNQLLEIVRQYEDFRKIKRVFLFKEAQL